MHVCLWPILRRRTRVQASYFWVDMRTKQNSASAPQLRQDLRTLVKDFLGPTDGAENFIAAYPNVVPSGEELKAAQAAGVH